MGHTRPRIHSPIRTTTYLYRSCTWPRQVRFFFLFGIFPLLSPSLIQSYRYIPSQLSEFLQLVKKKTPHIWSGEHIDYALFGVLPTAIERDILIACAPRNITTSNTETHHQPGSVVVENLDPKYGRRVFAPVFTSSSQASVGAWDLDIDTKELRWESYVKAGYYVDYYLIFLDCCLCSFYDFRECYRTTFRLKIQSLFQSTCSLQDQFHLGLVCRPVLLWS